MSLLRLHGTLMMAHLQLPDTLLRDSLSGHTYMSFSYVNDHFICMSFFVCFPLLLKQQITILSCVCLSERTCMHADGGNFICVGYLCYFVLYIYIYVFSFVVFNNMLFYVYVMFRNVIYIIMCYCLDTYAQRQTLRSLGM